jgi:hypothetical protein
MNDTMLDEQRKTKRRRVRQPAQIELDESSVVDCEIQNISEVGALIAVRSSEYIPDLFKLRMTSSEVRLARVKWRRARSIGVSFE